MVTIPIGPSRFVLFCDYPTEALFYDCSDYFFCQGGATREVPADIVLAQSITFLLFPLVFAAIFGCADGVYRCGSLRQNPAPTFQFLSLVIQSVCFSRDCFRCVPWVLCWDQLPNTGRTVFHPRADISSPLLFLPCRLMYVRPVFPSFLSLNLFAVDLFRHPIAYVLGF